LEEKVMSGKSTTAERDEYARLQGAPEVGRNVPSPAPDPNAKPGDIRFVWPKDRYRYTPQQVLDLLSGHDSNLVNRDLAANHYITRLEQVEWLLRQPEVTGQTRQNLEYEQTELRTRAEGVKRFLNEGDWHVNDLDRLVKEGMLDVFDRAYYSGAA
jgi:hypothetical protein